MLQVIYLLRDSTSGEWLDVQRLREKHRVSWTIILVTLLFVVCSGGALFRPVYKCSGVGQVAELNRELQLFYLLGYLPFFINAALNPVILVGRGQNIHRYFRRKFGLVTEPISTRLGME